MEEKEKTSSAQNPGLMEKAGLYYFNRYKKIDAKKNPNVEIPDDKTLARKIRNATIFGAVVSFGIGGISAGGSVFVEEYFANSPPLILYSWLSGVTLILTIIEFAVLYWVGLRTVFMISRAAGHPEEDSEFFTGENLPILLSRAALEIPDPVRHYLGIDPMARVSKRKLLIIGFIYKLKILLSNVVAKLILRRLAGKSILRISVAYVSVIITGLWNALVLWKTVNEARLRLFGNLLARHIAKEIFTEEKIQSLSERTKIGCIEAIGNSIVLTQNYHPNMLVLLVRLSEILKIKEEKDFANWENFLNTLNVVAKEEKFFLLNILTIAAAFDGKLSRLEKRDLRQAYGEHTQTYYKRIKDLKNHLLAGRYNAAKEFCDLSFQP